jgi:hypothetical protein
MGANLIQTGGIYRLLPQDTVALVLVLVLLRALSHPDLRANPNARIHVRQDQVTHIHRLSEYQNTV